MGFSACTTPAPIYACTTARSWLVDADHTDRKTVQQRLDAGIPQDVDCAGLLLTPETSYSTRADYQAVGHQQAWQAHMQGLRTQHGHKYGLMELLNQLDRARR